MMKSVTMEKAYEVIHHMHSVLVVEDDVDILSSVAEVLREAGFDVFTAANGYQALSQVKTHDPDLILLDLMMPQMNGWRFVQELRARMPESAAPIVLISAAENLRTEATRLGARAFLRKPFDLSDVLRVAEECCGGAPDGATLGG